MMKQRQYKNAEELFTSIEPESERREIRSSIHYMISKSRQGENLSSKNPFIAGTLSAIVPGLGRAYCNRWGDAAFSFLAVGVTILPAIYFYEEDRTFSIATGIAGLFFYGGNVYGSAQGAHNYNHNQHDEFYRVTVDGVPFPPSSIERSINP
jgi:hypothetical protein